MSTTTPSSTDDAESRRGRATGPALDVALDLGEALADVAFPLEIPGAAHARELRDRVLAQISSHLVPRLREAATPTVVVVGGPTGSGKSTLVNALAGEQVSAAGVVRPTTRRPVLVVHPSDEPRIAEHPVTTRADVVVADGVPPGVALLDAPDLDSVEIANRQLAVDLIETADLWLFVTTATRYGDALPWEILDDVRRRGVTIGVVLDRVAADVLDEVRRDLLTRLVAAGHETVPLFVVPDAGPLDGPLDPSHVAEVATWLRLLGSRATSREVVARTVRGVWGPLRSEVRELLDAVVVQADAATGLDVEARAAAERPAQELRRDLEDGALAQGSLTTRWLALAGSGGPLVPLAHGVSGFLGRRRAARAAPARAAALQTLLGEARASFADVVARSAARTETGVRQAWSVSEAGSALAAARTSERTSQERGARIAGAWDAWFAALPAPSNPTGDTLLDGTGARALLALAATGLEGARTAARRLWPDADATTLAARDALAAVADGCLTAEVAAFTGQVDVGRAEETATALRLRVGELRVLAGEERG